MSGGRDMDFDEEILRPILESGVSLCQLVSHEWERVDGALITAALRMNRTPLQVEWRSSFATLE